MKLRWKEFLLALVMAVALWFGISGSEVVESQIDVSVDYKGVPSDVIFVNEGLVSKVSVRVRGPFGQIRAMNMRDYVIGLDMSNLHNGDNILPVDVSKMNLFGALQVIDVVPSEIHLDVDRRISKAVPVRAELKTEIPQSLSAEIVLEPAEVTLSGASRAMENLAEVVLPVDLGAVVEPGIHEFSLSLPRLPLVDTNGKEVNVTARVDLKRKVVQVSRKVEVNAAEGIGSFVRPAKVSIRVALPMTLASQAENSKQLRAFVVLEGEQLGTYTLPVRVAVPEGALLMGVEPSEVAVTLEQKN